MYSRIERLLNRLKFAFNIATNADLENQIQRLAEELIREAEDTNQISVYVYEEFYQDIQQWGVLKTISKIPCYN